MLSVSLEELYGRVASRLDRRGPKLVWPNLYQLTQSLCAKNGVLSNYDFESTPSARMMGGGIARYWVAA